MTGEFDTPTYQSRHPPAKTFTWHPTPGLTGVRKYQLAEKVAQHYYHKYIEWQRETNDPALRNSNRWADNWEELGKFL